MGKKRLPILCLDFDGVLHSYESGWTGADNVADESVPGAMRFLDSATMHFQVAIYSARSSQEGGILAMQDWLKVHLMWEFGQTIAEEIFARLVWPTQKPPAFLTIDDRAICFTGEWPSMQELLDFKPWNK